MRVPLPCVLSLTANDARSVEKRFCQDLVVHDSYHQVARNPFRELIPFSRNYPFLHHIIIAASALHFSNATAGSRPGAPEAVASANALVDALRARHEAIRGLQEILEKHRCQGGGARQQSDKDAVLATVLFFLNFALVDSGKSGWRAHMQAAARLVIAQITDAPTKTLSHGDDASGGVGMPNDGLLGGVWPELECLEMVQSVTPLGKSSELSIRDYVASDSVAYYIWGCTLDSLIIPLPGSQESPYVELDPARLLPILRRTEANSYHSCPTDLLLNILCTARLARAVGRQAGRHATPKDMQEGLALLRDAEAFDVQSWVARMCTASAELGFANEQEVEYRKRIAATYRAAACLYVLLAVPGLQSFARSRSAGQNGDAGWASAPTVEDLAATIHHHLSHIRVDSPLFKYTTWPLFIMGVEIASPVRRLWVASRLQEMWDLCPWGMIRSAIETLNKIWQLKDEGVIEVEGVEVHDGAGAEGSENIICARDWRVQLRAMGFDCLIV